MHRVSFSSWAISWAALRGSLLLVPPFALNLSICGETALSGWQGQTTHRTIDLRASLGASGHADAIQPARCTDHTRVGGSDTEE